MQVNIHEAKTQLSRLIEAMQQGEDVVIARNGKPVARLVPVEKPKFKFGILKDKLGPGPDWFEPMDEEELRLWEGG